MDPLLNLKETHRDQAVSALLRLRGELADGNFLRNHFYTVDHSKFAGNTHHYWIRWGLNTQPLGVFDDLLPNTIPIQLSQWLKSELDRKVVRRLPDEYSTLIKIPFSVELGNVSDEIAERTARTVKQRLPAITPYAIFHLEINRLLGRLRADKPPPTDAEFDAMLTHCCRIAIAKARRRFPEVWDELRGHYVLDSRGIRFATRLARELKKRNLLSATTRFVDVGSGIGTNVFAINLFSAAHATGIEIHPGLINISKLVKHRLLRAGRLDLERLDFVLGDAFDSEVVDLGQFDLFYVYSPMGKSEIDIDQVVDRAKPGAVILFNRLPIRNRDQIEPLENVAGLYAFRKISIPAGE